MKNTIKILSLCLALSACASPHDNPYRPQGVKNLGGGVYSVSEIAFMGIDPIEQAVKQCNVDGGNLSIMTSTSQSGFYSGNKYSVIVFKCPKGKRS